MDLSPLTAPLHDPERGRRNLAALAAALGPDRFRALADALAPLLPRCPDPDLALNSLERFLVTHPDTLPGLLAESARALDTLLQLLAVSPFFADLLVSNPDFLAALGVPLRHTPDADALRDELHAEVAAAADDAGVLRAFRRFRQRHTLRIGANDVIRDRPLEEVTRDLSNVADAAVAVALSVARRQVGQRLAERPARVAAFAFGKLGGRELNYSSDIDLMFVYDDDGSADAGADEFFGRVVSEVVRLLSAHTDRGQAYRVDLRLRPEGRRGPLARSLASTLSYYDTLGRTWERQALIKLRPVAGDPELGREFLQAVEPFVYGKYLTFAEINEIKAVKRRIEQKARQAGRDDTDVKTGRGGIRDIEFAVQFLQLLNGPDLPAVRATNTLDAVAALASAGCLTDPEQRILDDAYRFLRRVEHRLQLLFDLQAHRLPADPSEQRKLARRLGYAERPAPAVAPATARADLRALLVDPLDAFLHDLHDKTRLDRTILDHLLTQAFADDVQGAEPESDLILAPDPDEETVRAVLGRYGFRDVAAAHRHLTQLAQE